MPEGGKGTVVLNRSPQPLSVHIVPYASVGAAARFPKVGAKVGWKIAPGETAGIPRRIAHIGGPGDRPPARILSPSEGDTLLWLTWE